MRAAGRCASVRIAIHKCAVRDDARCVGARTTHCGRRSRLLAGRLLLHARLLARLAGLSAAGLAGLLTASLLLLARHVRLRGGGNEESAERERAVCHGGETHRGGGRRRGMGVVAWPW